MMNKLAMSELVCDVLSCIGDGEHRVRTLNSRSRLRAVRRTRCPSRSCRLAGNRLAQRRSMSLKSSPPICIVAVGSHRSIASP